MVLGLLSKMDRICPLGEEGLDKWVPYFSVVQTQNPTTNTSKYWWNVVNASRACKNCQLVYCQKNECTAAIFFLKQRNTKHEQDSGMYVCWCRYMVRRHVNSLASIVGMCGLYLELYLAAIFALE